ncbi:uncharacterized protein JCM10292_000244 [Rhodotorula paludigena]|uniref:uncharacterized protein n=1 Tax=Rhodotorula paludigena TaxID=86838 RepID=UPI00318058B0
MVGGPAPTGRREPEARDALDKTRLINAGRLMARRDQREMDALRETIQRLEQQLDLARDESAVAAAMRIEGAGAAVKTLQREVKRLQGQVDTVSSATAILACTQDEPLPETPTSPNEAAARTSDLRRQISTLKGQLDAATKHESALESKIKALEAKGSRHCDTCSELRKDVERLKAEPLRDENTKLSAQLKLAKQSQVSQVGSRSKRFAFSSPGTQKIALDDKQCEIKQLEERLHQALKRVETVESDLRQASKTAHGAKAAMRKANAFEIERQAACDKLEAERHGWQEERRKMVVELEEKHGEIAQLEDKNGRLEGVAEQRLAHINKLKRKLAEPGETSEVPPSPLERESPDFGGNTAADLGAESAKERSGSEQEKGFFRLFVSVLACMATLYFFAETILNVASTLMIVTADKLTSLVRAISPKPHATTTNREEFEPLVVVYAERYRDLLLNLRLSEEDVSILLAEGNGWPPIRAELSDSSIIDLLWLLSDKQFEREDERRTLADKLGHAEAEQKRLTSEVEQAASNRAHDMEVIAQLESHLAVSKMSAAHSTRSPSRASSGRATYRSHSACSDSAFERLSATMVDLNEQLTSAREENRTLLLKLAGVEGE